MSFGAAYKRVRGKPAWFGAILGAICAVVMTLHWTIGLDPDWGGFNLFLSMEASFSMTLFMALQDAIDAKRDQDDEFQRKQLEYMKHLQESQIELLKVTLEALKAARPS